MSFSAYYNNLGINAFSIASVLKQAGFLTLPQLALILPIVAHQKMVRQLAHGRFRVVGFEQYLIDNIDYFYNFDERFTASITYTVNSIQFLNEIGVIGLQDGGAVISSELTYDAALGKRAERISRASPNIATLVASDAEVFYLNARIVL